VLWKWINRVISNNSRKIFQNFIYDATYLSRYGIVVRNLWHDTMLANKVLHAELPMGLADIARIYTREPYWKDEGRDWKNMGDINAFWLYNCKDTLVTCEAAFAQRKDLLERGLLKTFENRVMQLCGPAAEMSWTGFPINASKRTELREKLDGEVASLESQLGTLTTPVMGKAINPRSPQQVKEYFKRKGYRLPVKGGKETSDITAILKLQQKYPEDASLQMLVNLSRKNKLISTYLKPEPYPDGRMRCSFYVSTTDTNRWSSGTDSFGMGFNGQTVSKKVKSMFEAPEGWTFVELDLRQADARVVAWESCDAKLLEFFRTGRDIHRYVASLPGMFNKPESEVVDNERQMGKKNGHASNYGVMGQTMSDSILKEMGLVVPSARCTAMIAAYMREFPGVLYRQKQIQTKLRQTKKLTTPLGRERYFYGRLDDTTFRAAYAWSPQSIVNDVICSFIRFANVERDPSKLRFVAQVHDSALMVVRNDYVETARQLAYAENDWNPTMPMPAGDLRIPVEAKAGQNWALMSELRA
jgi:DNA polymerase-1